MQIHRDFLFSPLADLIRINSINPKIAPGAPGEREIGGYVATVRALFAREPFEVARDAEIGGVVDRAAGKVLGRAPGFFGRHAVDGCGAAPGGGNRNGGDRAGGWRRARRGRVGRDGFGRAACVDSGGGGACLLRLS